MVTETFGGHPTNKSGDTKMGLGDGIRELVADVGVQTADINTAAVTASKLASDQARWAKLTIAGTGVTACGSWTVSSSVTVLGVIASITTPTTADATVTVQDTAKSTIIMPARSCTAACTRYTTQSTALENAPPLCPLTAGESLEVTSSIATDKLAGTLYIMYIPT